MKPRIDELTELLNKYNYHYYVKGESLVTDRDFDRMMKELEELEAKYPNFVRSDSPTQAVGSDLSGKFEKVNHSMPMLSLENSYDAGDVNKFSDKTADDEKVIEPKWDGVSISLVYTNGRLVQAITRGDGAIGEDVTHNAMAITNLPHRLLKPISGLFRGEIMMPKAMLPIANKQREADGKDPLANCRNATAGAMKSLDPQVVKDRGLQCKVYAAYINSDKINTHTLALNVAKQLGLPVSEPLLVTKDPKKIIDFIEAAADKMKQYDFDTDGLVIKVNDLMRQSELGARSKTPNWATAFKFETEKVSTRLNGVTWQVGRTGKLTPVAELETVELAGTKVSRASMHNMQEVKRLGNPRSGDYVFIEKAAEIIPQVVGIDKRGTADSADIEIPGTCPVCGGLVARATGMVDNYCTNPDCGAKLQGYIEYFVGRDAMNIQGLGSKLIEKLIAEKFLFSVVDLYYLKEKRDQLIAMEGYGEKSIDKLLDEIEKSKKQPFQKVLYALGIQHVGRSVSKQLTEKYNSLDEIQAATKAELMELEGFGEKMAISLIDYFKKSTNMTKIATLKLHLKFENDKSAAPATPATGKLNNKTFLGTGKLSHFTRDGLNESIIQNGGVVLRGVTKKLDYLIVGEKAGSKLKKAEELGTVIILTEEEYMDLIK